jgi:hypothetical protein
MAKCNRFIVLVAALSMGCTAVYEGVNRFVSAPDGDAHNRHYTLIVIGEKPEQYWTNGGTIGPS